MIYFSHFRALISRIQKAEEGEDISSTPTPRKKWKKSEKEAQQEDSQLSPLHIEPSQFDNGSPSILNVV